MPAGFKDKKIAETLKQMALERLNKGIPSNVPTPLVEEPTYKKLYLALPKGNIPAASWSGGVLTLGRGTAYLLYRDVSSGDFEDWDEAQASGLLALGAKLEEDGTTKREIPVYNRWTESIIGSGDPSFIYASDTIMVVGQDPDGDYHILSPTVERLLRIQLTSALVYGNVNAYADILDDTGASTGVNIELTVVVGKFYGPIGAEGWAVYKQDGQYYEPILIEGPARYISFTLTEDMGETDSQEATIASGYSFWGAVDNPLDITVSSVHDPFDLFTDLKDGDKGIAVYQEKLNEYHVLTIASSAVSTNWGIAIADPDYDVDPPTIQVNPCDDEDGTNPDGTVTVYVQLPNCDEHNCNLEEDSVIAYSQVAGDAVKYVCVSNYTSSDIIYAKCISQWYFNAAAGGSADNIAGVKAHRCDVAGTVLDADTLLYINLPVSVANLRIGNCPNLNIDDVIAVQNEGTAGPEGVSYFVCVSDYMDASLGSVKEITDIADSDIKRGWGLMDGIENASGSGIDKRGQFTRGWDASEHDDAGTRIQTGEGNDDIGDTGGDDRAAEQLDQHSQHTPHASHTNHEHNLTYDGSPPPQTGSVEIASNLVYAEAGEDTVGSGTTDFLDHEDDAADAGVADDTTGVHKHDDHAGDMKSAYIVGAWVERLDNSNTMIAQLADAAMVMGLDHAVIDAPAVINLPELVLV